jgi:hypothetical protein
LLALAIVSGGLHGVVTRGPITPVCQVGTPCSAPAVGAVLLFSRGGRTVAQIRAGVGGRYAVRLAAGVYTVSLSPTPRVGFGLRPRLARVLPNKDRRVDFSIDTGIR